MTRALKIILPAAIFGAFLELLAHNDRIAAVLVVLASGIGAIYNWDKEQE